VKLHESGIKQKDRKRETERYFYHRSFSASED